ncbi:hypothetical protein ACFQ7B_05315 [Streptomyces erythrochromogenes]
MGQHFINAGNNPVRKKELIVMENTYDDIEFIETSAELLATAYHVNIQ